MASTWMGSDIKQDITEEMANLRTVSNSMFKNRFTDSLSEMVGQQSEPIFRSPFRNPFESKAKSFDFVTNSLEPIVVSTKEHIVLKVLVDYNSQKYCVCVESDYKFSIFKKILVELQRQISDEMSKESYWFEIFDKDFDEYVTIGSEFQAIEHLDRIRVRAKKAYIVAINCMEFEINGNYKLSPKCPNLFHKIIVEKFKDKFFVTIRFRSDYFKGMQRLLKLLEINRQGFEKRQTSDPFNVSNPWQTVSDQMTANGFDDWSSLKCRQCFTCAVDLYKKTLQKCMDFETASVVNPLFADFHVFELNHLLTVHEYNEIRVLRHLFKQQSSSCSL